MILPRWLERLTVERTAGPAAVSAPANTWRHSAHLRAISRVLIFGATATILASCFGSGDYDEIYIRYEGQVAWVLRVPVAIEGYEGEFFVSRIEPGADGVGLRWPKQPAADAMIEVLDLSCEPVATFRPAGRETYRVPEVSGLEITIVPWGSNLSKRNTPEILGVEQCGGILFH